MLGAGRFRFEFDWTPSNTTGGDWISLSAGFTSGEEAMRVAHPETDFGILLRNNGGSQFFGNGTETVGNNFDVSGGAVQRHARVDFTLASFADRSAVMATACVDNVLVGSRNFIWDGNNGVLYLELGNIDTVKQLDNISISTRIEVPGDFRLDTNGTNGAVSFDPPGGYYQLGSVVTVTATPSSGYTFDPWLGDLVGRTNTTTVTMNGNKRASAKFSGKTRTIIDP
jgi:Divergent InlB B-repeat domain